MATHIYFSGREQPLRVDEHYEGVRAVLSDATPQPELHVNGRPVSVNTHLVIFYEELGEQNFEPAPPR